MTRVYVDAHGYGFAFGSSPEVDENNRKVSASQVERFRTGEARAGGPYFAYWYERQDGTRYIGTWMGELLARVTWVGRPYRSPGFWRPSERVNFRAEGIDGRLYRGTYFKSSGSYVHLRWVPRQPRIVRVRPERINIKALERMDADGLWRLFQRLGASAHGHSKAQRRLKGFISNLATFKWCGKEMYRRIADGAREDFMAAIRSTREIRFYLPGEQ